MKTVLRQIAAHLSASDRTSRPDTRLAAQLAAVDSGALTEAEYAAAKANILGRPS